MVSGKMQYDWVKRPGPTLSFAFFFQPILPRLDGCYWVPDTWPLKWPPSDEAIEAMNLSVGGVTMPDTILPRFADQIVGDRDQFFGFREPPTVNEFYVGLYLAVGRDDEEQRKFFTGGNVPRKLLEQQSQRYAQHVRRHGCHLEQYLDAAGVEFAFLTNDTVWWFAVRDRTIIDIQRDYARTIPGLSCAETVSFGI